MYQINTKNQNKTNFLTVLKQNHLEKELSGSRTDISTIFNEFYYVNYIPTFNNKILTFVCELNIFNNF